MIAIIDYKAGNIASLVAALQRLGEDCVVSNDPKVIQAADKVIFPGQGRAAPAMRELQRTGLDKLIPQLAQPFLGICLGMQLLLETSEEDNAKCLGVIPGKAIRFQTDAPVPHVGWNSGYYFVHSYYVATPPRYTLCRAQYGGQWFASMITKDNFFGVQFHPEKSGATGLQLLRQFCETGRLQPTQVIPAIDVLGGQCVRLRQGDYDQVTQYSADPVTVAIQFANQGTTWLHVVDLDGAKAGKPMNQAVIARIVSESGLRVEVGGGIRTATTARQYLRSGVDRVILGTAAVRQPALVGELIQEFGRERVAVGLDVKAGAVTTQGWMVDTGVSLTDALARFKQYDLRYVIVTDVSKDGMLAGPNLELPRLVQQAGFDVIVSGGVTTTADIGSVSSMGAAGMIIGKALYEGNLTLKQTGFTKRIIACLDIAQGRVVKGTHFTDLKQQGDAVELAKKYEDQGADEIVFLDIMATVEQRDTLYSLVRRVAETLSIPFSVGGGVRTVGDIHTLLLAGADKVAIGSAAIKTPQLVVDASQAFGAQCIVISIDPKWNGNYWEVFTKGGREATGINAIKFAQRMEQAGAGELLVNSLDRDGTQQGYDLKLLEAISQAVRIPVIASSGVGTTQHVVEAFTETQCSAALVAGMLHSGQLTVADIKQAVTKKLIPVRL